MFESSHESNVSHESNELCESRELCESSEMVSVDPCDMLNNFCFHVYAVNSLIVGEIGNGFLDLSSTLSPDITISGAGSQLKIFSRHIGLIKIKSNLVPGREGPQYEALCNGEHHQEDNVQRWRPSQILGEYQEQDEQPPNYPGNPREPFILSRPLLDLVHQDKHCYQPHSDCQLERQDGVHLNDNDNDDDNDEFYDNDNTGCLNYLLDEPVSDGAVVKLVRVIHSIVEPVGGVSPRTRLRGHRYRLYTIKVVQTCSWYKRCFNIVVGIRQVVRTVVGIREVVNTVIGIGEVVK